MARRLIRPGPVLAGALIAVALAADVADATVVRTQVVYDADRLAYKVEADLREENSVRVSITRSRTLVVRDRGARRMVARAPGCRKTGGSRFGVPPTRTSRTS